MNHWKVTPLKWDASAETNVGRLMYRLICTYLHIVERDSMFPFLYLLSICILKTNWRNWYMEGKQKRQRVLLFDIVVWWNKIFRNLNTYQLVEITNSFVIRDKATKHLLICSWTRNGSGYSCVYFQIWYITCANHVSLCMIYSAAHRPIKWLLIYWFTIIYGPNIILELWIRECSQVFWGIFLYY